MATVIGAFETRELAGRAVDELIAAGFEAGSVSVLGRDGELADVTPENETANAVAKGAGVGAVVGGLGAMLAGAAALTIPGIGPVLALGPLSLTLTGAMAGGLIGYLTAQGVPEEEAANYAERVRAGAYLVAVDAPPGEDARARTVLAAAGAEAPIR